MPTLCDGYYEVRRVPSAPPAGQHVIDAQLLGRDEKSEDYFTHWLPLPDCSALWVEGGGEDGQG